MSGRQTKGSKILVSTMMITTMATLAACTSNTTESTPAPATPTASTATTATAQPIATAKPLDQVTLNIVFPGDPQPDQASVNAAIEKAVKDELNVKLNYTYVPWDDYATKVKVMTSTGGNVDILWTHPELLAQLISSNSVAALDDAIAKVGKDLKANIPDYYWPVVQVKGKTYGVPAAQIGTAAGYATFTVRKDLREKYGLPEIKTLDDMLAFYAAVKKNNPEIIPLSQSNTSFDLNFKEEFVRGLPSGVGIDMNTMKAENMLDTPAYKKGLDFHRELFNKGYISKDVLSIKDFRAAFAAGKAASVIGDLPEYNINARTASAIPGAQVEFVRIQITPKVFQEVTTWNYQSIAAGSKNIERAVAFLNWFQKNQQNYDLLTLGVEGKHYVIKDGAVNFPAGVDPAKPPYLPFEWIWQNPKFMKSKGTDVKGFFEAYKDYDKDVTLRFPAMGFLFDSSTIKTEVASLDSVNAEYGTVLKSGTADVDKVLPQFKEKMKQAGIDKAVAEVQKQLDAFVASKK
jgi:putative aldouronate transport system substrate-binding protein